MEKGQSRWGVEVKNQKRWNLCSASTCSLHATIPRSTRAQEKSPGLQSQLEAVATIGAAHLFAGAVLLLPSKREEWTRESLDS